MDSKVDMLYDKTKRQRCGSTVLGMRIRMIRESIQRREETDEEDTSASGLNAGKRRVGSRNQRCQLGERGRTAGKGGGGGLVYSVRRAENEGGQNVALQPRGGLEVRCRGR